MHEPPLAWTLAQVALSYTQSHFPVLKVDQRALLTDMLFES